MTAPSIPSITFIANHQPPLADGTYTLALKHTLNYTDPVTQQPASQIFSKSHIFAVCGDRFTLPPNEIHKVFPPANAQGDFDAVLPHVVLSRRTLPWERSPDGSIDKSWLAVMVFSQSEAPVATTGTLADLYPSSKLDTSDGSIPSGGKLPDGTYSYGCSQTEPLLPKEGFLSYGQNSTDACVWLDIAPTMFAAYAPCLADLQWNAHARQRTYKNGSSDDFAVVVATRLPPAGETVVAHLVSLEGLGDQLPKDDGTPMGALSTIRIVSLTSWSFRVGPLQESFEDVLKGLNGGLNTDGKTENNDSQLRLPNGYQPPVTGITPIPVTPFDSGYTVLAGQDPAWYRGPFVASTLTPPTVDQNNWSNCLPADHATTFDTTVSATPATDQSYPAAWQLGRLIALADKDFAMAQVAWKRDCRLKLNTVIGQANTTVRGSRANYAADVRAILANAASIQGYLGKNLTVTQTSTTDLYIPQTLVDWLGKLALLNSIPFNYLVPDANMLPTESIRFFNVDPRWIACLLDGAWSLGREPAKDKQGNPFWAFDTAYQPWAQLLNVNDKLKPAVPTGAPPWSSPVSGVLLNSRLLPGYWPGIDFALDADVAPDSAHTLREDRLGPNTLLLLFDQPFTTLTIQEPPEGIHFGFDPMDDLGNIGKKCLRDPQTGKPNQASLATIPQRSPDVIQFDQLAASMITALGKPLVFTAAEFALQLVEAVPSAKFTLP